MTSSLSVFYVLRSMLRCAVDAAVWSRTQLYQRRLTVANHSDVITQSSSGFAVAPTSGESKTPPQSLDGCGEACNAGSDDMTSQATPSDVSMTRAGCHDDDVTSYSVLSTSDVSQLLQASVMDDDGQEERRLDDVDDELREISRDLADIRAYAQIVSARCHDDKWRRGDALTLGVTEALTPHTLQTTARTVPRDWADTSTVTDWRLDESALDYESRDVTDRKLSLTCAAAEVMTSSPAEDSVADFYIDDELNDVII